MAQAKTLAIFGAGGNIGAAVAKQFASKGYKVALVSRRKPENELGDGQVHVIGDLADPSSVATIYANIRKAVGIPSVVVYNGEHANVQYR